MKIPVWLATILCVATLGTVGYFGKWAIDANATISSNTTMVEAINTKVNDNKENTNADIKDLKDAVLKLADKMDDMNRILNRMDRRQH